MPKARGCIQRCLLLLPRVALSDQIYGRVTLIGEMLFVGYKLCYALATHLVTEQRGGQAVANRVSFPCHETKSLTGRIQDVLAIPTFSIQ